MASLVDVRSREDGRGLSSYAEGWYLALGFHSC